MENTSGTIIPFPCSAADLADPSREGAVEPITQIDVIVGQNVAHFRAQAGLSQATLGAAVGCDATDIDHYETANKAIYASTLAEIGRVLNVPARAFFVTQGEAGWPQEGERSF